MRLDPFADRLDLCFENLKNSYQNSFVYLVCKELKFKVLLEDIINMEQLLELINVNEVSNGIYRFNFVSVEDSQLNYAYLRINNSKSPTNIDLVGKVKAVEEVAAEEEVK